MTEPTSAARELPERAVLALDVGGTSVRGAIADPDGRLHWDCQRPSGGSPGAADPGLVQTISVARTLLQRARAARITITAIGAGLPEYVQHGRLTSSEVLCWHRQPADLLEELAPQVPVLVESDVRCAALAEHAAVTGGVRGPASGPPGRPQRTAAPAETRARRARARSMYYVSWGTGLSGALVLDGRCVTGHRGEAIALGELPSSEAGRRDAGNLEAFASGTGIAARYRRASGNPATGGAAVFAASAAGDRHAAAVIESAGRAVATALGWVVALLDPDVVVLGGGIGAGPALDVPGFASAYRTATGRRPGAPDLVRARHGARSGLVGAALIAEQAAARHQD